MERLVKKYGGSLIVVIGTLECRNKNIKEGDMVEVTIEKIDEKNKPGKRI